MYAKFLATTDVIIEKGDKIVIVVRAQEPFKGVLEWPGGHVNENETVEECAIREAKEETGLNVRLKEMLGVYSGPNRDPRGPTITTVFVAEPISGELKAMSDAKDAKWMRPEDINPNDLGFDHRKILSDYLKWKKSKGTFWSSK